MEGSPSGGVYFTSPLVNFAAEAITAAMGVLFLGSPIPRLMTGSPRSRNKRASSFSAKVGDSVISLASTLSFIASPVKKIIWLEVALQPDTTPEPHTSGADNGYCQSIFHSAIILRTNGDRKSTRLN